MLLEIMSTVVKRKRILGKVCLLGGKEIQQNELFIFFFFSEMVFIMVMYLLGNRLGQDRKKAGTSI